MILRGFAFFSLLFATCGAFAGPLKETYRLRERGQVQSFVIAKDEIHGGRSARRIPVTRDAEGARTAASAGAGDLVLYPAGEPRTSANRRLLTKRLAVQLTPGTDAAAVAARAGARMVNGPRGDQWYVFEALGGAGAALDVIERLQGPEVRQVELLLARQPAKRRILNDPLLDQQWHVRNDRTSSSGFTIDANLPPAWDFATGAGITIGIVDDGLQHSHPDLAASYRAAESYDFNGRDADPEAPAFFGDDHGTACAGVAGASGDNGLGVAGAAFQAGLAGLRLISQPVTDEEEADAFAFHSDTIHIKSNSWGPIDDARRIEGPGPLGIAAIQESAITGRGGKGTIFVFAGGNGAGRRDNSNFDGYANRPEVIGVGAISDDGLRAPYSEPGANLLIGAPSSGGERSIVTTDRVGDDGYNYPGRRRELDNLDYTRKFGGTSSSCPLVAGVLALMLEVNPNLGWRDVQEILVRTRARIDDPAADWVQNGAGFAFSHSFGAGLIDAGAAVGLAASWTNLGPQIVHEQARSGLAQPIGDKPEAGVEFVFNVPSANLAWSTRSLRWASPTRGAANSRSPSLRHKARCRSWRCPVRQTAEPTFSGPSCPRTTGANPRKAIGRFASEIAKKTASAWCMS
jgi:subtilisin family serine protease